jgi:flagellar biosynthetic protein FliS
MNSYARSADQYVAQRILGASPEQQAALLMEAGQLFLGKAIVAMDQKDPFQVARYLGQVAKIINESVIRLNMKDGGELVQNLLKVYSWWTSELFEAGSSKDTDRLRVLSHHMGQIRQAWEQLHEKRIKSSPVSDFELGARVV